MKQVGFRNDRSIITAEGKLAIGIDRGMMGAVPPCSFFLGVMGPHEDVESSVNSPRYENFRGESGGERADLEFACQKLSDNRRVHTC